MQNAELEQFAHINIFTIKPGRRDEFIRLQKAGVRGLGDIEGFRGSQLFAARDGNQAIQVAFFDDEAAHRRFMASEAFQEHRQLVQPLLDGTSPGYFVLANQSGPASEAIN